MLFTVLSLKLVDIHHSSTFIPILKYFFQNNDFIYDYSAKLSEIDSIFKGIISGHSIALAISEAISWAIKMTLTDISKFIQIVTLYYNLFYKPHTTNPIIINFLKIMSDNIQLHISLIWIKRHKGIICKERADTLAKTHYVENSKAVILYHIKYDN